MRGRDWSPRRAAVGTGCWSGGLIFLFRFCVGSASSSGGGESGDVTGGDRGVTLRVMHAFLRVDRLGSMHVEVEGW